MTVRLTECLLLTVQVPVPTQQGLLEVVLVVSPGRLLLSHPVHLLGNEAVSDPDT